MTAKDHSKLLGIFHLIQGGLQAFGGIFIALIYGGMGLGFMASAPDQQMKMMGTMFIVLACIIAPLILIFAGINLMAGYKLLKEKAGARMWGIVASILCLMGFPLGTALGIYGLWFLFGEEGKSYYLGGNQMNYQPSISPPPHNWQ